MAVARNLILDEPSTAWMRRGIMPCSSLELNTGAAGLLQMRFHPCFSAVSIPLDLAFCIRKGVDPGGENVLQIAASNDKPDTLSE